MLSKIKGGETSPKWRVDSQEGRPLSTRDIIRSVEDAESHWRSNPRLAHGKAQSGFHRFCRTLDTHSNLLECLPSQSQYLSIFCGVTTTLIKVRPFSNIYFSKRSHVISLLHIGCFYFFHRSSCALKPGPSLSSAHVADDDVCAFDGSRQIVEQMKELTCHRPP